MVRDYSDAMFQKLCKTIDNVSESGWSYVWDKVSDVKFYFSKWMGNLDVERYINNMDDYHTKVLDQHNTSKKKLEKIFNNVYNTDDSYHTYMSGFRECADIYGSSIAKLCSLLGRGASSEDYLEFSKGFSKDLKEKRVFADESFSDIARKQQLFALRDNIFGTVKSIVKGGVTILTAPLKLMTNPLNFVVVCRDLCDSVFGTGSHLAGIVTLPLGKLIVGSDKERRNELYDICSGLTEVDGLVDSLQFEADRGGVPQTAADIAKYGNVVIDAVDIYTNIDSILDKAALIGKMDGSAYEKGKTLVKYLLWELGAGGDANVPGGPDIPSFITDQKATGEIIKNVGKILEFGGNVVTGDDAVQYVMDEIIIERPEYASIVKDLKGLYEDAAPEGESFYDFLCRLYGGSKAPKLEIQQVYDPDTDKWVRHLATPATAGSSGGSGGSRF